MAAPLLEIDALVKRFGGFTALNRVTLRVEAGERFGLIGPIIGAVLLATAQQLATVTISSELNLLIVGVVLVAFVVVAPEGILGLLRRLRGR